MDLTTIGNLTLTALVALGTVNVITFFRPAMDSRLKFALSAVVAFAASFIPADLGMVILTHAKDALVVALAASGGYKLAAKVGGE